MHAPRRSAWLRRVGMGAVGLLWAGSALAQTYTSGSTGALGALNPTANTTVVLPPDGILHYTTVNVPNGVTVTFQRNAANTPVTLLATGTVTIAGTLSVNGAFGAFTTAGPAALGGPGGFSGGLAGTPPSGGSGPGGGGSGGPLVDASASDGAPRSLVSLLPLVGGGGGGGGLISSSDQWGGGGGGGAIVIASAPRITASGPGLLRAKGGSGGGGSGGTRFAAGGASGGAIRLVAPEVTGSGQLTAAGGASGNSGRVGGPGRIRIESFTVGFTGTTIPRASSSAAPGPVVPVGNPGLMTLPTLTITSIGGLTPPATPAATYATADVSLPSGTSNPVSVTVTATNIPVTPTPPVLTVKVIPRSVAPSTVTATAEPGGTFETSTYTAAVSFPSGQVSLLNAFSSFTLPQIAGLFPVIDGEPVDHIMVAAAYGGPATLSLITKSGKQIRADALPLADQLKLASAFAALTMIRQ